MIIYLSSLANRGVRPGELRTADHSLIPDRPLGSPLFPRSSMGQLYVL